MVCQQCYSFDFQTRSLHLNIIRYGEDSIEIELINKNYAQQKRQKLKHILILLILLGLYCALATFGSRNGIKSLQKTYIADIGFIAYLIYLIVSAFQIVKKEKLLFCHNFALQLETERFCSRNSSTFISASNIYDVRINEVVENLNIHYLLIIRTKGELFKEKPIISLFNAQRPPVNCLELIYKNLNSILYKNVETTFMKSI